MLGTIAALLAVSGRSGGQPIVVPFENDGVHVILTPRVAGRRHRFALDSLGAGSSSSVFGARTLDLDLGQLQFRRVSFRPAVAYPGFDGFLGAGALASTAVGVDGGRRNLSVWLGGNLPAKDAEAWVTGEHTWDPWGPASCKTIPMGTSVYGGPLVATTIRGRVERLCVSMGFYSTACRTVPESLAPPPRWVWFEPHVHIGPYDPGWFGMYDSWQGRAPVYFGGDGVVTLDNFGERVLFDFAARKIYTVQMPKEAEWSLFLSALTRKRLYVFKGVIVYVPESQGSGKSQSSFRVTDIAGVTAMKMLQVLGTPTRASADFLADLRARTLSGFSINFIGSDYKLHRLDVAAPPRPH